MRKGEIRHGQGGAGGWQYVYKNGVFTVACNSGFDGFQNHLAAESVIIILGDSVGWQPAVN